MLVSPRLKFALVTKILGKLFLNVFFKITGKQIKQVKKPVLLSIFLRFKLKT